MNFIKEFTNIRQTICGILQILRRPTNEGQVKLLFSDNPTDPNYWSFNLQENVEYITQVPLPLVYSSITDFPRNIPYDERTDSNIIRIDSIYGNMWLENSIDLQPHWWRIQYEYARSDSSVDEQIAVSLYNPITGFTVTDSDSMLRGSNVEESTAELKTYADKFSIDSGYLLRFKSTAPVSIRIISITRESIYKTLVYGK